MVGYIYKIINIKNNKLYIGQSIQPIEKRFKRHLYDALENPKPIQTKFANAIRKYGAEAFKVELIVEKDCSADELTALESYYISLYDSINSGYNSTDARCKSGGNTYYGKSEQEMNIIKDKIRQTKLSKNNPHSRKIKCLNIETGNILYFDTVEEGVTYFNETNHQFIVRRCQKETKKVYLGKYLFAYQEDAFITDYHFGTMTTKNKSVKVVNIDTNEVNIFESYSVAEKTLGLYRGCILKYISKNKNYKNLKFILI